MKQVLAVINNEHEPDRSRCYPIDPVPKYHQKKSDYEHRESRKRVDVLQLNQ